MDKNGTGPNEYMHESIEKDAVIYDIPTEKIIASLCHDNDNLQAETARLWEVLVKFRKNEVKRMICGECGLPYRTLNLFDCPYCEEKKK